jgi:hypothetical protein
MPEMNTKQKYILLPHFQGLFMSSLVYMTGSELDKFAEKVVKTWGKGKMGEESLRLLEGILRHFSISASIIFCPKKGHVKSGFFQLLILATFR